METIWKKRKLIKPETIQKVSEKLKLNPIIAEILLARNLNSTEKIKEFYNNGMDQLEEINFYHPIQKAVDRILDALDNNEKIMIYGDYDCDGTVGSAIIYDYLKKLDADVDYYIPNRRTEGYGLNKEAISRIKDEGTNLIITVDNGITALDEIDLIKDLGMDVIVSDHHNPLEKLPRADHIINFKLEEKSYFKEVCGAGVAFLLLLALDETLFSPYFDKKQAAELVSIATIADIVELKGFNRDLVKHKLNQMNQDGIKNPALKSLKEKAQIDNISTGNIGFRIAPMINAAGRVGNAEKVVELLTSQDPLTIKNITQYLYELNTDRANLEKKILVEAEELIQENKLDQDEIIIVSQNHWHEGVIGIVASKIQEKYYKPVIIISFDEDKIGHASCRSIPGFSIFEALDFSKDTLVKYGGHNQAAGFTINKDNLNNFKEKILSYAKEMKLPVKPNKIVQYDVEISLNELDENLLKEFEKLEPFGVSNPEPVIKINQAPIDNIRLIGNQRNHLSFKINNIDCVYFNQNDTQIPKENGYSFLAKLRRNCYNENIQLILVDQKINPFLNFIEADRLIKNASSNKELQSLIEEFGQRNLINRKYLIKVYQLAKKALDKGFYVDDFIQKSNSTIIDLAIALNILKEAGLLEYKFDKGILKFKVLPYNGKAELKSTRTYQLLH